MSKEDCGGLVQLMDSGFSFVDAMTLLENKKNTRIFSMMKAEFNEGTEMVKTIKKYCPKEYRDDFYSFVSFLSLKDSLGLCVRLHHDDEHQKRELQKNVGYPLMMFFATLLGLYLFVFFCFPLLIQLMNDFNATTANVAGIKNLFLILLNVVVTSFFLCSLLALVMTRKSYQIQSYQWMMKYFPVSLVRQNISSQFARYFYHCIHVGCKTKETLTILKKLERKPVISFLAESIEKNLLGGVTMKKAIQNQYLDETLHRFMTIAMHTATMDEMLDGYVKLSQEKIKRKLKVVAKAMQLFTYGCIAMILIFVYQILILPLSVMSQL